MKLNDIAPDFSGIDQNNNTINLYQMLKTGKRVVLYFYPKNFTPGCTAEACSLRDGYGELIQAGFIVIGVSPDSSESHQKFVDKYSLPYTLIADEDHHISEIYGTWGKKKNFGHEYMGLIRKTFVINGEKRIERIFDKVNTKEHFEQIINSYK